MEESENLGHLQRCAGEGSRLQVVYVIRNLYPKENILGRERNEQGIPDTLLRQYKSSTSLALRKNY